MVADDVYSPGIVVYGRVRYAYGYTVVVDDVYVSIV